ncbi:MAG: methyltransferase [Clostridia bacterium]|nr:methyltransferase [Clostridia bacterium]
MADIEIFDGERLDKVNENISLICKTDGLTFGTDAYLLASFIRPQSSARAVELGAGTGIISLLLAARGRLSHITAIEVQRDFAELMDRNVRLNSLDGKITVKEGDVRDIRACDIGGEADVVFSNPPYMRTDSGKRNLSDRKYIARHEVCGGIGDFCSAAGRLLRHGGRFYCVWRPDRLSELFSAMKANRLEPKSAVFVHADEDSEPSMVLVLASKGGAEGMRIMPPLLLHSREHTGGARALSSRAERIYETMSFYE